MARQKLSTMKKTDSTISLARALTRMSMRDLQINHTRESHAKRAAALEESNAILASLILEGIIPTGERIPDEIFGTCIHYDAFVPENYTAIFEFDRLATLDDLLPENCK